MEQKQAAPHPSDELSFESCGRPWRLRRANMEALWEHMDDENNPRWAMWQQDERLPYWAELWPSSLALAAWLTEHKTDIQGKVCLDMGCGLGFTALVGQWLGGKVLGMDYDPDALLYARQNETLNQISGVTWITMDWRSPSLPTASIECLWAGDIVYERRFAGPVAAFLAYSLAPNGVAWLAEPGRAIFSCLLDELPQHGLCAQKMRLLPTWPITPQAVPAPVSIWEIRHAPNPASV